MATKKTSLPHYDEKRGWIGGDDRTLYTFTGRVTGAVGVYPGGGPRKKLLMNWGPDAIVRPATRAEAEEHWQNPLHVGWKVLSHATKKGVAGKMEKTMHEFKHGTLRSGSGGKVTSRKQAIAIGLSQARSAGYKVPTKPAHASMSLDARVAAYLSNMKHGAEINAEGLARAIHESAIAVDYALARAVKAGKAVTEDGRWFGPACSSGCSHSSHARKKRVSHAARKSPAQLDKEIAEFMGKPKLGDPAWERAWSELLTEKHSKARMPTTDEVARAIRYIDNEYRLKDDRVSLEQLAEGLAFGRYAGDAEDKRRAKEMLEEISAATWLRTAERANFLSRDQLETPRYLA